MRNDFWIVVEGQTGTVTVSTFPTNQRASALQDRDVTSENLSSPIRHVHNRTSLDRCGGLCNVLLHFSRFLFRLKSRK